MIVEPSGGHIRPVDPQRDLNPIADLIELCFAHQMDDDGRDYLRHIRRAARDISFRRWVNGANEKVSTPLAGYVWEENGRIVGNLTLIPFFRGERWRYLIANVATHPDFRGRGIARQLTQKGIAHVQKTGAPAVWLQVRDDNPTAHHLYLSLGFRERARRTTWGLAEPPAPLLQLLGFQINGRPNMEWPIQAEWLQKIYPPEVAWNLNFNPERYAPGLMRSLTRFLSNEHIEQWSIHSGSDLIGFAVWDAGTANAETVWVAPNPACEDQALSVILTILRRQVRSIRPLVINYPAYRGNQTFEHAGFSSQNTLIWMEINFEKRAETFLDAAR